MWGRNYFYLHAVRHVTGVARGVHRLGMLLSKLTSCDRCAKKDGAFSAPKLATDPLSSNNVLMRWVLERAMGNIFWFFIERNVYLINIECTAYMDRVS